MAVGRMRLKTLKLHIQSRVFAQTVVDKTHSLEMVCFRLIAKYSVFQKILLSDFSSHNY